MEPHFHSLFTHNECNFVMLVESANLCASWPGPQMHHVCVMQIWYMLRQ